MIGRGQTVGRNQRISLCRQVSNDSGSEDDLHTGSQAGESSTFGSTDNEPAHYGEQPSVAHMSDAKAAAAGNSLPSNTIPLYPFIEPFNKVHGSVFGRIGKSHKRKADWPRRV